ncbi:single-stranded DNA-binding protein [Plebeiibacterium sediminum]|uniref:Single-stranded DNA-binding protein n=1 Tax=Plebeiibacterium sediminum TaxID=2992112 RepID=A0AAE3SGG8_9BACT|nr:single-stranded DNA-binding protein [Plebeiobacterium sediminum]MCW3788473.1 single-stranded DNA-binding protein [Plebeiobacterium sediminum]
MSVNKVILIGNVGKDPEIRYFENDRAVANFPLATTERGFTTSSGQQIPDRTEWHNVVVWGGLAKVVESYVKKGTQIFIEGKLRTRSWDDKDGNKRYTTEVYADNIQLLGRKSDNPGSNGPSNTMEQQMPNHNSPMNQNQMPNTMGHDDILGESSDQDDLPF